jgi:hypothetical protein
MNVLIVLVGNSRDTVELCTIFDVSLMLLKEVTVLLSTIYGTFCRTNLRRSMVLWADVPTVA